MIDLLIETLHLAELIPTQNNTLIHKVTAVIRIQIIIIKPLFITITIGRIILLSPDCTVLQDLIMLTIPNINLARTGTFTKNR